MGRALRLDYVKYGSLGWSRVVPGIVPLQPTLIPIPRVHPPTRLPVTMSAATAPAAVCGQRNMVVGLILVGQLSLGAHFSGFHTITEVYNLSVAGK